MTATDFKFDPADQSFKPGEKIKITMTDKGAVDHTWVLQDANGAELVKLEVKVGATASKEFRLPLLPELTISFVILPATKKRACWQKQQVKSSL